MKESFKEDAAWVVQNQPELAAEIYFLMKARLKPQPVIPMTRRQMETFDYIKWYFEEYGVAPSYEEIKDHLGISSKSGVSRIIDALEERGKITRVSNRARAIVVIDQVTA